MVTAPDAGPLQQLTVRLPRALYARAQRVARTRKTSLSALVRGLLEELERTEQEHELERAYALLGGDQGRDVEEAFAAQAEVARRG